MKYIALTHDRCGDRLPLAIFRKARIVPAIGFLLRYTYSVSRRGLWFPTTLKIGVAPDEISRQRTIIARPSQPTAEESAAGPERHLL